MHGTGNDYVYVNGFTHELENMSELAIKVSDRHFAIGSDKNIKLTTKDDLELFKCYLKMTKDSWLK